MKRIKEDKFFSWLIWAIPIFITGPFSLLVWTVYQIFSCNKEIQEYKEFEKPIAERKKIIEMNKPENLTDEDKAYLNKYPNKVKIGEGVYIRKDWR